MCWPVAAAIVLQLDQYTETTKVINAIIVRG